MSKRLWLFPLAVLASLLMIGLTARSTRHDADVRASTSVSASPRVAAIKLTTRERWRVPLPSTVVGEPTVTADAIYVTTEESVVALRHDGTTLWSASVPGARVFPPRVDGAGLLVSSDHALVKLDRASGQVVWRFDTGPDDDARVNPAFVHAGVVVAMTDAGRVIAVDRSSGALRWESSLTTGSGAAIAGGDGIAVVVGVAEWAAFEVATGARAWSGDLSFIGTSSPVVVESGEGLVAIVATDNKLVAVGLHDGHLRWEAKAEQSELAQVPVLDDHGDLLVPDHWGRLSAYRVRDGQLLWKVAGADGVAQVGTPVVLADRVVALPLTEHGPRLASPDGATALRPPAPGWGLGRLPDGGLLVSTWGEGQNYLVAYDVDLGG